jgi:hypothetical protein
MISDAATKRAEEIAAAFAALPEVVAVALAGSRMAAPAAGLAFAPDADLDLYVYASTPLPIAARAAIAAAHADPAHGIELDNRFWEPGDEWRDRTSGLGVDLMYRTPRGIEDELARVLDQHEAALGYTTCFWHNVRHSRPLFDPHGWYRRLQVAAEVPYPERLRRAIVAKNAPLLRRVRSAYLRQLEAALRRNDPIAVNHRLAALLASYFDLLFALNRQPHPGEKRLLAYAEAICPRRPPDLAARVGDLFAASAPASDPDRVRRVANGLIDDLDALLGEEGLLDGSAASPPAPSSGER